MTKRRLLLLRKSCRMVGPLPAPSARRGPHSATSTQTTQKAAGPNPIVRFYHGGRHDLTVNSKLHDNCAAAICARAARRRCMTTQKAAGPHPIVRPEHGGRHMQCSVRTVPAWCPSGHPSHGDRRHTLRGVLLKWRGSRRRLPMFGRRTARATITLIQV